MTQHGRPSSRLTCQDHAHLETLLEAAELTAVALRLGDLTVAVCHTRVHPLVLHGPLEEALASETEARSQ